jgi:cbb3-type cytochrome oxidase subunit 1
MLTCRALRPQLLLLQATIAATGFSQTSEKHLYVSGWLFGSTNVSCCMLTCHALLPQLLLLQVSIIVTGFSQTSAEHLHVSG